MILLSNNLHFPSLSNALEDGLLCIGGDLSVERLTLAYQEGIFPWYNEGEPILWYSPDPRFVLFIHELRISKSMHQLIRSGKFHCTINSCFDSVVLACQQMKRIGQDGTWITDDMTTAYRAMHDVGKAMSVECWIGNQLVGGLYGVKSGAVFSGESMFSKQSNASKVALIYLVEQCFQLGIKLIDCQVYTTHLESLGARMIERDDYVAILKS